jgi:predicted nuclease of predicted toxin-antitoxin system
MKLLFDQNISYKVVINLTSIFEDCKRVKELALENKTDREIWQYTKNNGFTIVTFEADFHELATIFGHPPKIIWLRTGNINTTELTFNSNKFLEN